MVTIYASLGEEALAYSLNQVSLKTYIHVYRKNTMSWKGYSCLHVELVLHYSIWSEFSHFLSSEGFRELELNLTWVCDQRSKNSSVMDIK